MEVKESKGPAGRCRFKGTWGHNWLLGALVCTAVQQQDSETRTCHTLKCEHGMHRRAWLADTLNRYGLDTH